MTPLTLEEIEKIERECERMWAGPWQTAPHCPEVVRSKSGFISEATDAETASYIARCDPDTIRRLCAMAKRAEKMRTFADDCERIASYRCAADGLGSANSEQERAAANAMAQWILREIRAVRAALEG